ncbi:MAG: asparagine synthase-related protein [Erythrobacter sp.]|uniref:asparagine synthetase B family protein n=1 Tax=Erythrobacter sp. TaxID=1042 RepID=UPI002611C7DE|nr:asparagine synthase-related protein [Erythrobacter sp.]MDJ0978927.1 asparagine synthase-related protein [Erythrobacter sp.]
MSGIGAVFHRDARPVERESLERMSRSLAMYGPEKRVVRPEGEIGFAYTHFTNTPEARLAAQPLVSPTGRYTFLLDGRIDNRADLAEALIISPATLARMSDAALALEAWQKWGADGLTRWIGEFAAIIWDRDARAVNLVRDPFGRRPLYYNVTDRRLAVASMPKGLHALGDISRELDTKRLTDALTQYDADLTRSYYREVSLVAPATITTVSRDRIAHTRYYSLRDNIAPFRHARDEDYLEEARELFDTAMSACLRSPGPIGSHLSGGMDSSFVAAHAAQRLAETNERLSTYTWVPVDGFTAKARSQMCYDESPAARAMAQMYNNIDINLIGRDGPSLYDGLSEYILAAESLLRNGLNVSLVMASARKAREDGVRVMLNGQNGNITLSYNGVAAPYELLRKGRLVAMLRDISRHARPSDQWRNLLVSVLPRRLVEAVRTVKSPGNTAESKLLRESAATPDATLGRNIMARARSMGFEMGRHPPKSDDEHWMTYLENYLAPVEANALAAMPALFGHELRDPFMDRRIIEWRFGVPATQFRRDGKPRFLMRRLIDGQVPDMIRDQTLGRGVQSADWLERLTPDLARIKRELEIASGLQSLNTIIDAPKISGLLETFPTDASELDTVKRKAYASLIPIAASMSAFAIDQAGVNYGELGDD